MLVGPPVNVAQEQLLPNAKPVSTQQAGTSVTKTEQTWQTRSHLVRRQISGGVRVLFMEGRWTCKAICGPWLGA